MTGSSGSGIAPSAGTHHPVRAVNLKTVQGARAPAHARDRRDAGGGGRAAASSCASCPVSAPLSRGILATSFVELPADDDRRSRSPRSTPTPTRASRSSASCAIGCPRSRRSRAATTPRSASRWARRRGDGRATLAIVSADRQPDQGRRRPGDPEHEPDARACPRRRRSRIPGRGRSPPTRVRRRGHQAGRRRAGRRRRWRTSAAEIARARAPGARLLVVHGGGPQATALSRRLGIEPQHRRRPPHHRRADARRHEDGGRRAAQRRSGRGAARGRRARGRAVGRERRHPRAPPAAARRLGRGRRADRLRSGRRRRRLRPASCSTRSTRATRCR